MANGVVKSILARVTIGFSVRKRQLGQLRLPQQKIAGRARLYSKTADLVFRLFGTNSLLKASRLNGRKQKRELLVLCVSIHILQAKCFPQL